MLKIITGKLRYYIRLGVSFSNSLNFYSVPPLSLSLSIKLPHILDPSFLPSFFPSFFISFYQFSFFLSFFLSYNYSSFGFCNKFTEIREGNKEKDGITSTLWILLSFFFFLFLSFFLSSWFSFLFFSFHCFTPALVQSHRVNFSIIHYRVLSASSYYTHAHREASILTHVIIATFPAAWPLIKCYALSATLRNGVTSTSLFARCTRPRMSKCITTEARSIRWRMTA
ncbi:unnamed protein product [Acanthosepion pharaonis]|uniref:Uncharacterized protein n=1 Tax=Acanthosepion pharaonis TaxID=158019 RepID=A0A812D5F6_ACAPH|nr:unnamed protein product [Sepia pharaonis]